MPHGQRCHSIPQAGAPQVTTAVENREELLPAPARPQEAAFPSLCSAVPPNTTGDKTVIFLGPTFLGGENALLSVTADVACPTLCEMSGNKYNLMSELERCERLF